MAGGKLHGCVLISITGAVVFIICLSAGLFLLINTKDVVSKAEPSISLRDPRTNAFWQYANFTVKTSGYENHTCIVCSLMPHSAKHPFMYELSIPTVETALILWRQPWPDITHTHSETYSDKNILKDPEADISVKFPQDKQFPVWVMKNDTGLPSNCSRNSHGLLICRQESVNNTELFQGLEPSACVNTLVYPDKIGGQGKWIGPNATVFQNTNMTAHGGRFIWKPDCYWFCGVERGLLLAFPAKQRGRCALVFVNIHMIIHATKQYLTPRTRRNIDNLRVPPEHALVSETDRFFQILFPNYGVGKVRQQLDRVHYRLAMFVNETLDALEGIRDELTAIRLMTTQNRLALDIIMAEKGGVCVMIGEHCCTYIPPNDSPLGNITTALAHMHKVAKQLRDEELLGQQWNLNWTSFFTHWKGIVVGIMPTELMIILLLCFGPMCCQCMLHTIHHRMQAQFQMVQGVAPELSLLRGPDGTSYTDVVIELSNINVELTNNSLDFDDF